MKQRSDYTFKFNQQNGRHGWLRLTPAYSIKLVKENLYKNGLSEPHSFKGNLLDPFSGTATTGIVAAEMGLNCTLYDINPFLVWFGNIKAANYPTAELDRLKDRITEELPLISTEGADFYDWVPPMKNIERWWDSNTIKILASLRRYIAIFWGKPSGAGIHNLIWIAFARLVIETSAADFNHISVSFKDGTEKYETTQIKKLFLDILSNITGSARQNLPGKAVIVHGDSRLMNQEKDKYDLVLTSPPYPNRISYIRELRPYMYWLGFLNSGEEAGEIDWKAIGGTWGKATSNLSTWSTQNKFLPDKLHEICHRIETADPKSGRTLSQYVLKFFDDMYIHLDKLRYKLKTDAKIVYILGNSSFYGNFVETDSYIKDILNNLGYSEVNSEIIRKRNCNKGLFEYNITARWTD